MKRVFDFTVAGFGLVVLSPVLLALAVAIKVSDGGPVFFRQQFCAVCGRVQVLAVGLVRAYYLKYRTAFGS